MSAATFAETALFSNTGQEMIGGPRMRGYSETMPGQNGLFFQGHGTGGRQIRVSGVIQATGETAALAHAGVMTALRTKQALADGSTMGTYAGTDGNSYSNCVMYSYDPAGPVMVGGSGTAFQATLPVVARLIQH